MRHQTSLGASTVAPVEQQYVWRKALRTVTATGQTVRTIEEQGPLWAAWIPGIRGGRVPTGYGHFEVGDGQLAIQGQILPGGHVLYPEVVIGDELTDDAERVWEVLRVEEHDRVAVLLLTVRQVKGRTVESDESYSS